jgi:hypothetical protein
MPFPAKTDASIPAFTSKNLDFNTIDKHGTVTGWARKRDARWHPGIFFRMRTRSMGATE